MRALGWLLPWGEAGTGAPSGCKADPDGAGGLSERALTFAAAGPRGEDWRRGRPLPAAVRHRWVPLKDVWLLTVPALQIFFTFYFFSAKFWSGNESLHVLSSPFCALPS